MGGTVTEKDVIRWIQQNQAQARKIREISNNQFMQAIKHAQTTMINPPSSPPPTDTAEKLYLQIRICAEQYTGSKYVKKEYQIELPANVVGLGGEAGLSHLDYPSGTWVQLVIPVILQAPSSNSPEEVTPTAPQFQYGWTGEKLS